VHCQLRVCKFTQLGQVFFSERARMLREFAQKFKNLPRRIGHLAGQRQFRIIRISQQMRLFRAQFEYLRNQRRVVPFRLAKFAGALAVATYSFSRNARLSAYCSTGI